MVERDTIERVAASARLELSEDEIDRMQDELEAILDAFASLDEADTEGVEPAFHPVELPSRERDDEVEEPRSQDEALANTDNTEDGYFIGPRATE